MPMICFDIQNICFNYRVAASRFTLGKCCSIGRRVRISGTCRVAVSMQESSQQKPLLVDSQCEQKNSVQ